MTKSAAEIRKDLKVRKTKKGNAAWFSFKEGKKLLRIGPPWEKDGEIWKDVLTHGHYKSKVYCAKNWKDEKTGKLKKCLVCQRVAELKSDRSPYAKKLWSLIRQGSEGLWNVLVVQKFKQLPNGKIIVKKYEDDKFKAFRLSFKWQNLMMGIFGDEDLRSESILGVTHPKSGRLIKAKRTGSGADDTVYNFDAVDVSTPISKDPEKRKALLATLINLDNLVTRSSREELEAFLEAMEKKAKHETKKKGGDDEEEEDEEEEESEDEDSDSAEEEDAEEDDDDEDDEEEEKGDLEDRYESLKKKAKKKKKHDDDDD